MEYVETRDVPIKALTRFPGNARRGDVDRIRESIRRNGQYRSLVVRDTGDELVILAGNHTHDAIKAEGHDTARCEIITCDDAAARRINLADNKLAELGVYDHDALAELLSYLDGDYVGTGYSDADVEALITPPDVPGDGDSADTSEARKSLAERFGVPPFTVLDARQGYWQDRKAAWLALGIASGSGRERELIGGFANAAALQVKYDGRTIDTDQAWAGTSIFDPVLCELLIRWYSAPGQRVLDPFAGGSVRGIVSTRLGRDYTGVDLRPEQIEANEAQLAVVGTGLVAAHRPDYTPNLTPVEVHAGIRVKRDDAWSRGGATGAKSRTMFALAEAAGSAGIITAGARRSPQIERAALVAQALGISCRVHVPDGADTAEIGVCLAAGAEVIRHPAGRLSVLRARHRDDADKHPDWLAVPFGMGLDAYADDVATQAANLPGDITRIVVPAGSGMTLAGILRGLDRAGRTTPILAVSLGHDPAEYLDRFAPDNWRSRIELVTSTVPFDDDAPNTILGELHLDPMYEAKCLPFLHPGDLLWCVGIRDSAPQNPTPGAGPAETPTPRWIVGDSRNIRDLIDADDRYDLMLTCPPYFDLEVYSDDPADLSRAGDYRGFLQSYEGCLAAATDRMRPDAFAAIVTGPVRDRKGYIQDLPSDTTRIMESLGWRLYQDAVLLTTVATAAIRAARSFALRKLTRTHQAVAVYHRGDINAVRNWPPVEVGDVEGGAGLLEAA